MQLYKLNLLLVNSRYGDLEQRVIRSFIKDRKLDGFWWFSDMEIMLSCIIEDGLVHDSGQARTVGGLTQQLYKLTQKGTNYIAQWPTMEG